MRRIASMAQGYQICHCEERSDVAISRSRLRIRRDLPVIRPILRVCRKRFFLFRVSKFYEATTVMIFEY